MEVAELRRDRDVALHRAAEQGDVPAPRRGQRQHLLDAMDMGGECGEDDPARGVIEALGQRGADLDLGLRVTRSIDVGAVRAQHGHALLAQLREASRVGGLAVERARIELEVAGVDDRPGGGANGEPHSVGDGVRHADRLDGEGAEREGLARPHRPEIRRLGQRVLAQLVGDEGARQWRRIHGQARRPQEIGQRADVVLVAVREHDAVKALALGERIREIRDDVIDARQLVVGKHQPAVDGDDVVTGLDQHHVEADLAQPAERNQPNGGFHRGTPFTTAGSS